jgi:hypothetical protein
MPPQPQLVGPVVLMTRWGVPPRRGWTQPLRQNQVEPQAAQPIQASAMAPQHEQTPQLPLESEFADFFFQPIPPGV